MAPANPSVQSAPVEPAAATESPAPSSKAARQSPGRSSSRSPRKPSRTTSRPSAVNGAPVKAAKPAKAAKQAKQVPRSGQGKADAKAKAKGTAKVTATAKAAAQAKPKADLKRKLKASKPAGTAAAGAVRPERMKLVRDSFTLPQTDVDLLVSLKQRALKKGHEAKKSELVRAGIHVLAALDEAAFTAALGAVPRLKTGRPEKKKGK